MKTGVEQAVYAVLLLHLLPERAVLPGEAISRRMDVSPTYFQKLMRKLVNAGVLASVPGVKGGFKLQKKAETVTVYDIYAAVEGQRSLYASNGVLGDLLALEEPDGCCIVQELMDEAEAEWMQVLRRETIASLAAKLEQRRFREPTENLKSIMIEQVPN